MANVIGVDLGGTKIALGRYNLDTWELEASHRIDTHANEQFEHVYNDMIAMIKEYETEATTGVGVGVPGLVAQPAGTVVKMPNIPGAENFPLKDRLASDMTAPIPVDNDANCFALAEALHGAGKGHRVFAGVTLGTGVGGGIVIDGRIFQGGHGYAAEFGHMLLVPGSPPYDTEDKRGEVEQFISGTAMGKRCEAAGKPEDYLDGEVCEFMRPEVLREVAWLCTNLTYVLDPSIIAFGGSAGRALKPHIPAIEQELTQWLLPGTPLPKLTVAELPHAATFGAALLTQS